MTQFSLNAQPKPQHKRNKKTAAQRGLVNSSTRKKLLRRSGGLCERCKRGGILQAAHLIRRWRIEGVTTVDLLAHLCIECHFYCDNTRPGREWLIAFRKGLEG